ncbi:hypothetical protein L208DRAFT_1513898, partial [Tricholoma matsutake]
LRSPDGSKSAQVLFKAGKSCDGYFTNEDIIAQTQTAMDIVQKHYPPDEPMFIFDNATTHLKCPATAPSATKMTKNPSMKFGTEVMVTVNGRIQYALDGKPHKVFIQMGPGQLPDREPQLFYDSNGVFIGMT